MNSNWKASARVWIAAIVACGFQANLYAQSEEHSLTYNGQIGQIINENCVVCHQDGGIGPMQFETYDQVLSLIHI